MTDSRVAVCGCEIRAGASNAQFLACPKRNPETTDEIEYHSYQDPQFMISRLGLGLDVELGFRLEQSDGPGANLCPSRSRNLGA